MTNDERSLVGLFYIRHSSFARRPELCISHPRLLTSHSIVETIARSPARSFLLLLLIASATLLFRLGRLPLSGSDEPRYARIAEEMLASGRWITPVLEGRPWFEKPPLYYWLTMPLFATLGVGETTARLAPALCG